MGHGPAETIEHAEHAGHAAHNPFDKRVTLTIAIVAAILAGVTMAGHRAHTDTLQKQGEALKEQAEALVEQSEVLKEQTKVGIYRVDISDQYNYYQAKKNLTVLYEAFLGMASMLPIKEGAEKNHEKHTKKWKDKSDKYAKEMPEMLEKAKKLEESSEEHQKIAKEHQEKAKEYQESAHEAVKISHVIHAQADRFDAGELGLQLGVVLCSLAILTKSRNFWLVGILSSLVGLLVALSGVFGWFMGGGHH